MQLELKKVQPQKRGRRFLPREGRPHYASLESLNPCVTSPGQAGFFSLFAGLRQRQCLPRIQLNACASRKRAVHERGRPLDCHREPLLGANREHVLDEVVAIFRADEHLSV